MTTLRDKLIAYELFRKRSGITPTTDREIEELVDQFIEEDHKNNEKDKKKRKEQTHKQSLLCMNVTLEECMGYEFCNGCPAEKEGAWLNNYR